ncbi:fibronectin type III domain-containing protein [Streptomyces sp. MP131-18]|uniref:fibronectin type III domain-containing protein n=1 Tax=Streptomyces sp. MP131-18 TaxID=1857892 RepID=UPI0009C6F9A0|nr:fibronectin type III domain-containing protein [Streptomyces sp. MP131-18]ONK13140.1 Fibronectin type III domain protein [Streptomyces sp. MP131-18]
MPRMTGTYLVVHPDTRAAVLQRVMWWAQEDRSRIRYHIGNPVSYVHIPAEVFAGDHGDLVLAEGSQPIEPGIDRMVWVEPTVFEVDGIHPDHGIEYDMVVEGLGAKGEPTTDTIVIAWDYSGNSQERTEPDGWVLRYRAQATEDEPEHDWLKKELRGYERVVPIRRLEPDTTYEFSVQGAVGHGSARVLTAATVPITIATAAPDQDGNEEPQPPAPPAPEPEPEQPQSPPPGQQTPPPQSQPRPQASARRSEPRRASSPEKKETEPK